MKRNNSLIVGMLLIVLVLMIAIGGCGRVKESISSENEPMEDITEVLDDVGKADGDEGDDSLTEKTEENSENPDGIEEPEEEPGKEQGNDSEEKLMIERMDRSWSEETEDGVLLMSTSCFYPNIKIADNPEASERINAVFLESVGELEKSRAGFLEDAKYQYQQMIEQGTSESFWGYAYDSDYMITYQSDSLLCVKVVVYSYLGGAHPNSWIEMYHFDLNSGECLCRKTDPAVNQLLGSMANDKEAFRAFLLQEVMQYVKNEQWADGMTLEEGLYPDYQDTLQSMEAFNWYVREDSLWIVFNEYDIAPYAAGSIEVEIPLAECEPYLSEYGKQLLGK